MNRLVLATLGILAIAVCGAMLSEDVQAGNHGAYGCSGDMVAASGCSGSYASHHGSHGFRPFAGIRERRAARIERRASRRAARHALYSSCAAPAQYVSYSSCAAPAVASSCSQPALPAACNCASCDCASCDGTSCPTAIESKPAGPPPQAPVGME